MIERIDRRRFLAACAAGGAVLTIAPARPGHATPQAMQEAIRRVLGEAAAQSGRVKLDVPALVENGNAVPLTVTVDSPMSETDHVTGIHIFNEKNPQPYVAAFDLSPRAGRAAVSTRIRLADSQQVVAIVRLNDGSFWSDSADVIVTLAACAEG